jgi:hypothetical protein
MRRKLDGMKPLLIAAAATAALAGSTLIGSAGAQTIPATLELVQLERDVSTGFVDNPPRRRESAGDVFTIRGRVRDAAGRPAGRAEAVFTQTGRRSAAGAATFVLSGGQLMIAGIVDGGSTDTLAVVGGTGAYEGAAGTVRVTEGRRRTSFSFSLR